MQAAQTNEIVRIADLAERLRVTRGTLRRWEIVGALPARRVFGPGLTGWFAHEIDQWMNTRPRMDAAASRQTH